MSKIVLGIDDLPGDGVLADPVCGAQGQVLLAAGSVLTRRVVESLRRLGVRTLTIETPAAAATSRVAPDAQQVHARVRVLFRHAIRTGVVNPLMHFIPPYRLGDAP
jgi:hypothetical protein